MANYTGQDGSISVNDVTLGCVTAFSVDHTLNTIETTCMGKAFRSYTGGMAEWSGSADVYFESTDVATVYALCIPSSDTNIGGTGQVAFIGYPGGDTVTNPKLTGNIIVTGLSISSETEGLVTASISFQGTGALTLGVQA